MICLDKIICQNCGKILATKAESDPDNFILCFDNTQSYSRAYEGAWEQIGEKAQFAHSKDPTITLKCICGCIVQFKDYE